MINSLKPIANDKIKYNGKTLIAFGRECKCTRNIGQYKIFSDKRWEGNGLGNYSDIYIVDTKSQIIYSQPIAYSHDEIVKCLKREIEEERK